MDIGKRKKKKDRVAVHFKHALLVLANLVVSLAVAYAAGGVYLGFMLATSFNFRVPDLVGYVLFLATFVVPIVSFLTCSWIFASHFARIDRRGHLSVVWGIPTLVIVLFLVWFIGTAPGG